jgi:hypothetical protein
MSNQIVCFRIVCWKCQRIQYEYVNRFDVWSLIVQGTVYWLDWRWFSKLHYNDDVHVRIFLITDNLFVVLSGCHKLNGHISIHSNMRIQRRWNSSHVCAVYSIRNGKNKYQSWRCVSNLDWHCRLQTTCVYYQRKISTIDKYVNKIEMIVSFSTDEFILSCIELYDEQKYHDRIRNTFQSHETNVKRWLTYLERYTRFIHKQIYAYHKKHLQL